MNRAQIEKYVKDRRATLGMVASLSSVSAEDSALFLAKRTEITEFALAYARTLKEVPMRKFLASCGIQWEEVQA